MTHVKWILLLVCVAYALWPLLATREGRTRKEGKSS